MSEEQLNKILELLESGKKNGATVACGGNKWGTEGFFVEPTVFADVTDDMRIAKEEVMFHSHLLNTINKINFVSRTHSRFLVQFRPFSNFEQWKS